MPQPRSGSVDESALGVGFPVRRREVRFVGGEPGGLAAGCRSHGLDQWMKAPWV